MNESHDHKEHIRYRALFSLIVDELVYRYKFLSHLKKSKNFDVRNISVHLVKDLSKHQQDVRDGNKESKF